MLRTRPQLLLLALAVAVAGTEAYTRQSERRVLQEENAVITLPTIIDHGTAAFYKHGNGEPVEISFDESCSPAHPMNWWIVKFHTSYADVLSDACKAMDVYLRNDYLSDTQNFTEYFMEYTISANEIGGVSNYIDTLNTTDIEHFVDQALAFWTAHNGTLCELVNSYAKNLDMVTFKMSQSDVVESLAGYFSEYVELLERNQPVFASVPQQITDGGLWGLDRIDQTALPGNNIFDPPNTGGGVHIYILDTGINSAHVDYAGRIGNGADFIDNDSDPEDCKFPFSPTL